MHFIDHRQSNIDTSSMWSSSSASLLSASVWWSKEVIRRGGCSRSNSTTAGSRHRWTSKIRSDPSWQRWSWSCTTTTTATTMAVILTGTMLNPPSSSFISSTSSKHHSSMFVSSFDIPVGSTLSQRSWSVLHRSLTSMTVVRPQVPSLSSSSVVVAAAAPLPPLSLSSSSPSSSSSSSVDIQHIDLDAMEEIVEDYENGGRSDSMYVIIDVRRPEEIAITGPISPHTYAIPIDVLVNQNVLEMDPIEFYQQFQFEKPTYDETIVFTCAAGRRSAYACTIAAEAGYTKLINYKGGSNEWF
jgi:thiosulfate:glutathione sulfurtransferase